MGVVEADGSLRADNHNRLAIGALAVLTGLGDRAQALAGKGPLLGIFNGDISYSDGVLVDWAVSRTERGKGVVVGWRGIFAAYRAMSRLSGCSFLMTHAELLRRGQACGGVHANHCHAGQP